MNNIFVGIVSIVVAIGVLCLQSIIDTTPPIYILGLVVACFSFGFIFGANHD